MLLIINVIVLCVALYYVIPLLGIQIYLYKLEDIKDKGPIASILYNNETLWEKLIGIIRYYNEVHR